MNAIQVIKQDHRTVERLFKEFERAEKAERTGEMKKVVRQLVKELSVHAMIEEQLLYPTLRRAVESLDDEVLEGLEEHHLVKVTLLELDKMGPDDERFCPKVTVLAENVRHHVKEEEHDLLPRLAKALSAQELRELGDALQSLKRAAPTRPHPAAPDTPPGNLVAGAMAALYDRGRDVVRDLAERGRERTRGAAGKARGATQRAMDGARSQADQARRRTRAVARRARAAARDVAGHDEHPSVH